MKMLISNGNRKIGKDTLILNMTSATDCPAKEFCQLADTSKCYALKAERLYPRVLPYRRNQTLQWDSMRSIDIANEIVAIAKRKKTPIKYLRFSEAGDFRDQWDVLKMHFVASYLLAHGIKTYGYSARRDLDFSYVAFTVTGSGFMVDNQFVAVKEYSQGAIKCQGDCRTCNMCKLAIGITIEAKIH